MASATGSFLASAEVKREFLWWMPENITSLVPVGAFYREYEGESTFAFVSREPVRISLTCRVPGDPQGRPPVVIEVNGHLQTELEACDRWCTCSIDVEAPDLVPGKNRLRICWPTTDAGAKAALRTAAEKMERGQVPELYPMFGEIHTLMVRRLPRPPASATTDSGTTGSVHAS